MKPFGVEHPKGWGVKLEKPSTGGVTIYKNLQKVVGNLRNITKSTVMFCENMVACRYKILFFMLKNIS